MSKLHALAFAAVLVSPAWIAARQPGTAASNGEDSGYATAITA